MNKMDYQDGNYIVNGMVVSYYIWADAGCQNDATARMRRALRREGSNYYRPWNPYRRY